jgi:hypothetical protein
MKSECRREEVREETSTCTGHDLDVFVFVFRVEQKA